MQPRTFRIKTRSGWVTTTTGQVRQWHALEAAAKMCAKLAKQRIGELFEVFELRPARTWKPVYSLTYRPTHRSEELN